MSELKCTLCDRVYPLYDCRWRCDCGHPLDIRFNAEFPVDRIASRKPGMWRYREALPISLPGASSSPDSSVTTFNEGFTPVIDVEIEGRRVHIKQEQLFATGSYKDRGASVLISHVKALGISRVVEDSSGNAGASIAAYCAAAGIECDIFVPSSTSPAKLAQIECYGAHLHKIPGTREDTSRAVLEAARSDYYASHSWNPFFFHGTKTFAFEAVEQLGWRVPDTVILPVGNGTLFLGAFTGFCELKAAGIISHLPRLIGVQAENCAPLAREFERVNNKPFQGNNDSGNPTYRPTIAEGIAIASPIRGKQILQAVKDTCGGFYTVSETEIIEALNEMLKKGHYIEPTSAAVIAGVKKYIRAQNKNRSESQEKVRYEDNYGKDDEILFSVFTGHGLKAGEKIKCLV